MGYILGSWSGMRKYLEQRMFAILDRRIGKRTITYIIESLEYQPEWLKFFYCLRLDLENI